MSLAELLSSKSAPRTPGGRMPVCSKPSIARSSSILERPRISRVLAAVVSALEPRSDYDLSPMSDALLRHLWSLLPTSCKLLSQTIHTYYNNCA